MSSIMIEVKDLLVEYNESVILDHLSFSVNQGEILIIAGGSGCGKTTLLNHLIGLKEPVSGSIKICGHELVQADEITRQKILRRLGVMFQSGALFSSMNLLENVSLPLQELTLLPEAVIKNIALEKLDAVGLAQAALRYPAEISGGMQKRAAIARAMALMPEIIFLDEPSAGLDPITSAQLDHLIKDISKNVGITFVMVTHELASMQAVADRIIMLHHGKILEQGTFQKLTQSNVPDVFEFFNRNTKA